MRRLLVVFLVLPMVAQAGFPFSFWKQSIAPPPTPNLWYNASTLGLSNGATVSSIANLGSDGAGANATLAGSGADPVYATYSQNGLSSITFAAGKHYTTAGAAVTYPTAVAIITKVTGAPGYTLGASSANGPAFLCYINAGNLYMEADKAGVGIIGTSTVSTVTAGGWHLFLFVLTSTTWAFYIDDALVGSGSNSIGTVNGGIWVGDQSPGPAPYSGSMGEVFIYNSVSFSSTQRAQLHTYSQIKWGTP